MIADVSSLKTAPPDAPVVSPGREHKKRTLPAQSPERHAAFNRKLHRFETKYLIPMEMVGEIRDLIRPFCEPDPNGVGDPPTYVITTIQLDSPALSLHHAKEWDAVDRFKLRVRTYGDPVGKSPVFMEVKGKERGMVVKYRCQIPFARWGEHLFADEVIRGIDFKSGKDATNFYQFIRLTKQIGARPVMLIRYHRESYFGKLESYARVTFDTRLEFQQTHSWCSWGAGKTWRVLDNPMMQTRRQEKETNFSAAILELKALQDVPHWMVDIVSRLDLMRVGHCKYSNAVWAESLYHATPWTPEYEVDLLRYL